MFAIIIDYFQYHLQKHSISGHKTQLSVILCKSLLQTHKALGLEKDHRILYTDLVLEELASVEQKQVHREHRRNKYTSRSEASRAL